MAEKLFPDPFLKSQNCTCLWINSLKFVFILCQVECYRNILKLTCRPLAFLPSYKALLKSKKRSGTSHPASFSAWFLKRNISLVIFYQLIKFHCLVDSTLWDIGPYVYCNCLLTRLWRHKLKLTWSFQSNHFFYRNKKSAQKFKYL